MLNKIAPCGTVSGYQRHSNHREPKCEPCSRAKAEYNIEYNFNRKLKRDKLAKQAKLKKEYLLARSIQAMEVLRSGRKTA